jgi:arylsulfatase
MPDDVGYWNVGAYSHGMMVPTPNIDRIAKEGILFTDHYSSPTCTPGRAMFITGQLPIRTGLTTVGMPGSNIGLSKKDPTIAEVLKKMGYKSGQYGKNHLGDRNEHLPTVHGFDEFYGNLYHLNSEEEPFLDLWPKDKSFNEKYRPRGIIHSIASKKYDSAKDKRFGETGYQTIKDTGALSPERMKTVDEEFLKYTLNFIENSQKEKKPFFAYFNPTRMHIYTHLKEESKKLANKHSSEFDLYGSGLMELDKMVGVLLDKLDQLKISQNTIVIFTTDNGAMADWYPDGGATPFRGEKATTYEGGVRVPLLVRWPSKIKAQKVSNGIQDHTDLFTTLLAAAGESDVAKTLEKSHGVKIDGVNNLDHWVGEKESARNYVLYYNEKELSAVRIGHWKSHFKAREGFFDYNRQSSYVVNLRQDPFEKHDGWKSREIAMRLGVAWGGQVQDLLGEHYKSLKKYPPRQEGGSLRAD